MTDVDDVVPLASKGKGVEGGSVNEILVAGQDSAEGRFLDQILVAGQDSAGGGFLDEILVAGQNPADEGICISRVTVATVGRDVVIVPDNPDCSIQVVQDGLGVVLGKYSVEQICDAQSKDPEFKWLTEWLDDNSCQPAQGDLFRSSPPAKFYWTIKERFSRDERGMIMYHAKDGEGNSEWYHGRCVGISPQEAEECENQDYICSGCKIQKSKPDPPQASMNPTGLRRSARSIRDVQKRSWAAEEKREEKREEVSARGRHRDRVPSVERDTPSLRDTKGHEGEAEVPREAISGDHKNPSPKAGDTSFGCDSRAVSRSQGMGALILGKGLGQVVGSEQVGTPVKEGADAPFPGAL
ncbi:KDM5 [Mytilus coruscus]|uniref:KDM5 n=1 Tax=Mytilus coruscus TaxID=42192 RepID=A0A6J8DQA8_MYTCO|nr:KDM5 [Mytilus coruscus]